MRKRLLLVGLFLLCWMESGLFASAKSQQGIQYLSPCEERSRPVLAYQNLLTDSPVVKKRTQEFWFDRNKEVLQGLWFSKKEPPMYLAGKEYSENQFYLCAYKVGQKKAFRIYLGRYRGNGIQLFDPGKPSVIISELTASRFLPESRTYGLRYDHHSILHDIPGKIPKSRPYTCEISVSTFQVIPTNQLPIWNIVNTKLSEHEKRIFDITKESDECASLKDPPRIRAMAIQKMFANNQYLSAKIDISQSNGSYGGLSGDAYNVDLVRSRDLTITDVFDEADQTILLKEIAARTKNLYGSPGRLKSFESVKFSFNAHTLVISYEPIDVEGQFLPDDYVDIPVPLDSLFKGLGIKAKGPFIKAQ
jgi:hypothetical protein